MIELTLPYPPSGNALYRANRGRVHKSGRYVKWLRDAGYLALAQKPGGITGAYKLSIDAVRPDKRKRDLDNLFKATSDLLVTIGVVGDDSECEMISARWVTSGEGMTVRVERAGVE